MRKKNTSIRKTARDNRRYSSINIGRWFLKLSLWTIYAILLYQFWLLFHVLYWKHNNPQSTAFMERQLQILHEDRSTAILHHQWVSYRHISDAMKRAVVAAEDSHFLQHSGFDYEAIWNAFKKNRAQGSITAGGSTISQQLAKNLFLSDDKSFLRKAQEAIITIMLEQVMSKQRILEIYLNVIEWGNGVFGVEAAAQHYFSRSAAALAPHQAALLAAMIPQPRYYDNNRDSLHLLKKRDILLKRLHSTKIP
ncbi:MAG: monofunctional biosynthetic peptidoglycan transglycosylase [Nitrosomonas sp.]|nr:monofunctional biosynthetic peptidoglycan transglycosylase [Nitrosomonas sp.]MCW5608207.1 monofunctional biosynthetic peptidoglycan transglycosylase [Nitrosomonas sp.]